jgi:predicted GNAT superfamily acetyltransferase
MKQTIRDVAAGDLDAVLELNEANVPEVGSVNLERMAWFASNAQYFRIVEVDGRIGAFLVGLRPGTSYDSPNYGWFCERYEDFGYVDRVAVADHARRLGLGSRLYADFEQSLPPGTKFITCEVNIRPPNDVSMRYHETHGFEQVGTLESADGKKAVAMLAKPLGEDHQ